MFNQEVIDRIRREELAVLICMTGTKSELPGLAVGLGECCSCQGVVHYDLANKSAIEQRGLTLLCCDCFVDGGLFDREVLESEGEALIGGQSLTMKEGFKTVIAMREPPKESN